jgi:MFS family permease
VLIAMSAVALATVAPAALRDFDLPAEFLGYQATLMFVAAMFASAFGAGAGTRFGPYRVNQVALLMNAAGMVLLVPADLIAAAIGSALIGVAYGVINPASSILLVRMSAPGRRNFVFSLRQTGVPLGGAAAGILLPPLALLAGWEAAILAPAAATLVLFLAIIAFRHTWGVRDDGQASAGGGLLEGIALLWSSRRLSLLAFGGLCMAIVHLCLVTFLVTMLVEDLGYGLAVAGSISALTNLAGAAGRLACGAIADRIGGMATLASLAAGCAASAAATAALGPQTPFAATQALFLVFGVFSMAWNGVYIAEAVRAAPPGKAGEATGGALAASFASAVVGPPIFASLLAGTGLYTATFGVLMMFPLVALCAFAAAQRTGR